MSVCGCTGGQTHSASWRRTGEHHAVELTDVSCEAVNHAANLLHQRSLRCTSTSVTAMRSLTHVCGDAHDLGVSGASAL